MFTRPWEHFFESRLKQILDEKSSLLDVGGGLRIDPKRNNRVDATRTWLLPYIEERRVSYRVLDYVDTYHPDLVGDVQNLPMDDDSEEAIACMAVLEHVENPIKAATELHRVLKPGGYCFVYVPFLYYYHAELGYYSDYWRFTHDAIRSIFKPFSTIELMPVRGPFEMLVRLSPMGRYSLLCDLGYLLDKIFGKLSSHQVAGYYVFLKK